MYNITKLYYYTWMIISDIEEIISIATPHFCMIPEGTGTQMAALLIQQMREGVHLFWYVSLSALW